MTAPAIVPTVGGTYTAAPCDALGKGVARCGSTMRLFVAPEGLADRPGWWHVRCVRCDAPFLWRPEAPPAPTEASSSPAPGSTYWGASCVAPAKRSIGRCGSTLWAWVRPEALPEPVPPGRRGWWHTRCARCDAPGLWRPEAAPAQREEVWTLTLRGPELDLLDALAGARDAASPDAFGPMGHRPGIVAEALALGLRALSERG